MREAGPCSSGPAERGAALLAALALVALLSGLAALGLTRVRAASDAAVELSSRAEERLATLSAVAIAQDLITELKARADRRVAALEAPLALTLGDRRVVFRFTHAGACVNLNAAGGAGGLRRLLDATGLPPAEAERVAEATRIAVERRGLMWAEPSEWRAAVGLAPEAFAPLAPLLCTLPTREPAGFNVNALTAAHLPVLVALGLSPDQARRALAARPAGGFRSTADFWQAATGAEPDDLPEGLVGTTARWFQLEVTVDGPGGRSRRKLLLDTAVQPARIAASAWLAEPEAPAA
ncbi:MAG: general secretion pathway protein GspK [Sphingomonadaceae bacterium]|uniref:type II secretion system protein GspK n=1 Tax=Thermaurantiacus sp. TaxID=2820283 RepID=UPI00298F22CE|nr:type II secretion system protein GspK [Thermaurantiacus sp.]MCS6987421.1 general secretion pathway protein GspK [Sphingomonadaceae bacterium]MDW8415341.1 type II secretion system protein GspK [Thermaurantiacus sp.]